MAKSKITPAESAEQVKTVKGGGEKIEFKTAAAAQKLYWETWVGKNKITAANCPESCTFDFHNLKAYLNEVEAEFNRLNVPYGDRSISVMPIAHSENGRFSVMLTPSVPGSDGLFYHQFKNAPKSKVAAKSTAAANGSSNYNFQLNPLNGTTDNP